MINTETIIKPLNLDVIKYIKYLFDEQKEKRRIYYMNNKDKYIKDTPEFKEQKLNYNKKYMIDNKDKITNYYKNYYKNNKDKYIKDNEEFKERKFINYKKYYNKNKDNFIKNNLNYYYNNKEIILNKRKEIRRLNKNNNNNIPLKINNDMELLNNNNMELLNNNNNIIVSY